jgi:hypothetical protein
MRGKKSKINLKTTPVPINLISVKAKEKLKNISK